jgi:hypothetical protein
MIIEYLRSFVLVFSFVAVAVLIANALKEPLEPMRPFTDFNVVSSKVKPTKIDIDDEIDRQRGWK